MKPHRGHLILMTGLLSMALVVAGVVLSVLVVCVFCDPKKPAGSESLFRHALVMSVAGGVLGFVARWRAKKDIHKMRVGRMDRSGQPITNGGRVCGIIGMAVAIANAALTTILWMLIDTAGSDGVARWFR
ncbi:MAG: hypothetical protein NTY01_21345 [Verrucomicrobia bacterium]|nr:hypothetical protein [Verrucomicrobiota bacterium]